VLRIVGFASGLLLLASAIAKILDPRPTSEALRTSSFPSGRSVVVMLAMTELVIGFLLLSGFGAMIWILGALLYFSFAAFLLQARFRGLTIRSCGCFGRDDTGLSPIHVVVVSGIAVALAVEASLNHGIDSAWPGDLRSIVVLMESISLALALYAMLGPLPTLLEGIRHSVAANSHDGIIHPNPKREDPLDEHG
jgi:hypothetical protein